MESAIRDFNAFQSRADAFFTKQLTLEQERAQVDERHHRENVERLDQMNTKTAIRTFWTTIAGVVWTVVGVLVAIMIGYLTLKASNHTLILPLFPHLTHAPFLADDHAINSLFFAGR